MINLKNILVTTTSSVAGLEVKQYIKPVSAHIVAGTNVFSDFFASFSDVFGGRSQTYQRQLSSLYNDAIERLKIAAYEVGANCILGLHVDLDEISGKGKSMFMLTAMGTAVVIDENSAKIQVVDLHEKFENISVERIRMLRKKKEIIDKASAGNLGLDEETWDFIILNRVFEVYDFIIINLKNFLVFSEQRDSVYQKTVTYVDSLPEEQKLSLLYESILKEEKEELVLKLCTMIEDLQLLDFVYLFKILEVEDFQKKKRALRIITYDKPFYNKQDIETLRSISQFIKTHFPERGVRSMKKQLLSSKEKEVWTCECKSVMEVGKVCGNCKKDIYGFFATEIAPPVAISSIEEKINLISEYVK